jgi:hypothetical protein
VLSPLSQPLDCSLSPSESFIATPQFSFSPLNSTELRNRMVNGSFQDANNDNNNSDNVNDNNNNNDDNDNNYL